MCFLNIYDKNFSKHFTERYKEKDDFFGASEIDNILNSNY